MSCFGLGGKKKKVDSGRHSFAMTIDTEDKRVGSTPGSDEEKDENLDYDYLFKILLIGDSNVGKSSLLTRFSDDKFSDDIINTVGVDFKFKTIELEGKKVKLQIWDTAGQERFRTVTSSYYRGAHGIIIVYDITSAESFKSVTTWIKDAEEGAPPDLEKSIVGNKSDLESQRAVSVESAHNLATELSQTKPVEGKYPEAQQVHCFETSAKSGTNAETVFIKLATQIFNKSEWEKAQRRAKRKKQAAK